MGLLSRLGARLKLTSLRFTAQSSRWGNLIASRSGRAEWKVGDGSGSSIVVAAVGWIARNYPEARLRVRERDGTELEETEDEGAQAMLRLIRDPNEHMTGPEMAMCAITDYWVSGDAFVVKIRDQENGGRVVALWWVPSWLMEARFPSDGSEWLSAWRYRPSPEVYFDIPPNDVIHHRWGYDPANPRRGLSPLKSVLREIMTDEESAAYTIAMLSNFGVPGVIIAPDDADTVVEKDDADSIKAEFMDSFGGNRRGLPMVVSTSTKVSVLSFSPQQMDLRALRRIPEERVTAVLGVPAIVAGMGAGLDRSTFANFGEAREAGYEENLIPTQRLWAARWAKSLLPEFISDPDRFEVDHDYSEVRVLAEDQNKLWERGVNAAARGVITLADFNRMVGLPVDDQLHDVYLRPINVSAVRVDSPEATGEEPPEPETPPLPPIPPDQVVPGTVPVEPAAVTRNGNGNGNGAAPVAAGR